MRLRIRLMSDSAFGRGDGIAGLVDEEVEHDPTTGLPFIKGRTIKGLLVESCADILYALQLQKDSPFALFNTAAGELFGVPGSTKEDTGWLHVGMAEVPEKFKESVQRSKYRAPDVLNAMTTIRNQTAVDTSSDKPADNTLRATRVVLRETILYAPLHSAYDLQDQHRALLAACAFGMQRGGLNRTRGLGRLDVSLDMEGREPDPFEFFTEKVGGDS